MSEPKTVAVPISDGDAVVCSVTDEEVVAAFVGDAFRLVELRAEIEELRRSIDGVMGRREWRTTGQKPVLVHLRATQSAALRRHLDLHQELLRKVPTVVQWLEQEEAALLAPAVLPTPTPSSAPWPDPPLTMRRGRVAANSEELMAIADRLAQRMNQMNQRIGPAPQSHNNAALRPSRLRLPDLGSSLGIPLPDDLARALSIPVESNLRELAARTTSVPLSNAEAGMLKLMKKKEREDND